MNFKKIILNLFFCCFVMCPTPAKANLLETAQTLAGPVTGAAATLTFIKTTKAETKELEKTYKELKEKIDNNTFDEQEEKETLQALQKKFKKMEKGFFNFKWLRRYSKVASAARQKDDSLLVHLQYLLERMFYVEHPTFKKDIDILKQDLLKLSEEEDKELALQKLNEHLEQALENIENVKKTCKQYPKNKTSIALEFACTTCKIFLRLIVINYFIPGFPLVSQGAFEIIKQMLWYISIRTLWYASIDAGCHFLKKCGLKLFLKQPFSKTRKIKNVFFSKFGCQGLVELCGGCLNLLFNRISLENIW